MSVKIKFSEYEVEKIRGCLCILSGIERIKGDVELSCEIEELVKDLVNRHCYCSDYDGNVEVNVMSIELNQMLEAMDVCDCINHITDAVEIKKIKALKDKIMQAVKRG